MKIILHLKTCLLNLLYTQYCNDTNETIFQRLYPFPVFIPLFNILVVLLGSLLTTTESGPTLTISTTLHLPKTHMKFPVTLNNYPATLYTPHVNSDYESYDRIR